MDGKILREARQAKGLSQYDLALCAGVTQGAISQLEKGERGCAPATLAALSRVLGVSEEKLYSEPSPLKTVVRNLQGLRPAQLLALNEVILQLKAGVGT